MPYHRSSGIDCLGIGWVVHVIMEWLANAQPAVVLMESCKGCHVRARDIADLGHDTRLVKGADVKALRNVCQKNDIRDADYIARLLYVPGTKFVFVKNQRQGSSSKVP